MSDKPRRVGAYYRVSKARNAESVDVQQRRVQAYCDQYELRLVREFSDLKPATAGRPRPGLEQCLCAAEAGEFDLMVVAHSSRAFRNLAELVRAGERLKHAKVMLLSINDHPDTQDTPEVELARNLLGAVNHWDGRNIGHRLNTRRIYQLQDGKWPGGPGPLGARWDSINKRFVIIPDDQAIALAVFTEYIRTASFRGAAVALNARGIPTRNGRQWEAQNVKSVLCTDAYRGFYTNKGDVYELQYPELRQIVPPAMVAEALHIMGTHDRPRRKARRSYAWSGLLVCGVCGSSMHMVSRYHYATGDTIYYGCSAKYNRGTCPRKSVVREDVLDASIPPMIIEQLRAYRDVYSLHQRSTDTGVNIDALRERRRRLLTAWEDGLIEYEEFQGRMRPLADEIMRAEQDAISPIADLDIDGIIDVLERGAWLALPIEERRKALYATIEHVIVPDPVTRFKLTMSGTLPPLDA